MTSSLLALAFALLFGGAIIGLLVTFWVITEMRWAEAESRSLFAVAALRKERARVEHFRSLAADTGKALADCIEKRAQAEAEIERPRDKIIDGMPGSNADLPVEEKLKILDEAFGAWGPAEEVEP